MAEGGECNHCIPIKPEEVSPWLCLLSEQGVGGVEVARSGVSGPGRKEPDPGACLGQPFPTSLFAALGSSDAYSRASVSEAYEDCRPVLLLLGKGVLVTSGKIFDVCCSRHVLPPLDPVSSMLDVTEHSLIPDVTEKNCNNSSYVGHNQFYLRLYRQNET